MTVPSKPIKKSWPSCLYKDAQGQPSQARHQANAGQRLTLPRPILPARHHLWWPSIPTHAYRLSDSGLGALHVVGGTLRSQLPGLIELQRAQSVLGATRGRMKRTNMPLERKLPPLQWAKRHRGRCCSRTTVLLQSTALGVQACVALGIARHAPSVHLRPSPQLVLIDQSTLALPEPFHLYRLLTQ